MPSSDAFGTNPASNVVFRVDGGRTVGMGHIVRCVSLAGILFETYGCHVSFCMHQDDVGMSRVRDLGWPVFEVGAEQTNLAAEIASTSGASLRAVDAIVLDLASGMSPEFVRSLRASNPEAIVLLMDGNCAGRLEADLIVSPIERRPLASEWQGFRGERYEGPAYATLDPSYADVPRRGAAMSESPRVFVTMGGSDPCGLTLQALRALDAMPEAFVITIAIGPAFLHEPALERWRRRTLRAYEIVRESSLRNLMVKADLAVVSFGTTVYELAATGLPAIALSISEDHLRSAEVFAQYGSMISLGLYSEVPDAAIQKAVRELTKDRARWSAMARRGQEAVDGKGAERVAQQLLKRIRRQQRVDTEAEVGKSQRA